MQAVTGSLDNIGVLVTRPAHQADAFINLLTQAGARPVPCPVIEIRPPAEIDTMMQTLGQLEHYDMLIFISTNAVEYGLRYLEEAGKHIDQTVAAIGRSTAASLQRHGVRVSLQPGSGFNTEALLAEDAFSPDALDGKNILIFRGQGGRELLADSLRARGAKVNYAEVYQRCPSRLDSRRLNTLWREEQIQIVTVTSNEALKNLYHMLDTDTQYYLLNTPLVVPGQRCAELAEQTGFKAGIFTAANATDEAMLACIRQWHNSN